MTFVTTQPEMLAAAADRLQRIGTAIAAQNEAAVAPTIGVIPAAADEVSALPSGRTCSRRRGKRQSVRRSHPDSSTLES